ncbi:MAG: hypothetical protein AMJ95_01145 [Omnitrophica WOR_2 bacterium SM23_72]|nr:MAG: hypothetical protein AMJ95_01145 [Omnitrophica WOR_2 bacterium SM23_72]
MRIAAINKPMRTKIALISLFNIDFGVRYISSFLYSKGYSTNIISFGQIRLQAEVFFNNYILPKPLRRNACPPKDVDLFINLLQKLKPDLIGISVPSTSFITASILTQKIKEKFNLPVVWGGLHPTLCPEDCLQYADIVCIGEGEYPMLELAQKIEHKEDLTGINNLWIKREDGSIKKNDLRNLIQDLDSLPYPDFVNFGNKFLIDEGKIISDPMIISAYTKNEYPIMSSRGCHFSCSFCCNSVLKIIYKDKGPYLRRRTPENVVDELAYVRKNKPVLQLRFWDDVFTYDQDWIEKFCQLYTRKIALPFSCYTHPKYTDKRIIQMLARAGLGSVDIGIQSGSENFCKNRLKRYQSNEEVIDFANELKKLDIVPRYNLIMDNPFEEDSDFDITAELLLKLPRPYKAGVYSLCYFPRIELTNQAVKDGLITPKEIEGENNKALNNFYMCIDLAKDKKRFFWDTIMAMVVSGFFPEGLIRKCKHSKFLRYHPKFLLILLRLYLRISLFSPVAISDLLLEKIKEFNLVNVKHKFRHELLFNKNPRFFLSLAKLYLKANILRRGEIFIFCSSVVDNLERYAINTPLQTFKDETKIELLVFPEDSPHKINRSFFLKIRKKEPTRFLSSFKLRINIYSFGGVFVARKIKFGSWKINLEVDNNETDIKMDLQFPYLFFTLKGVRRAVVMKDKGKIMRKDLYIISFVLYDECLKRYTFKNNIIIHPDEISNS